MANRKYEEEDVNAIVSAICEKTGGSKGYKLRQIPDGVNEVYEAGKKAEHDAFWDEVFKTAGSYIGRFAGEGWTAENFRPTKDIIIVDRNANYCFYNNGCEIDLVERCEELGINIVIKPTMLNNMFCISKFIRLPQIDLSNASKLQSTFDTCSRLVTIDKLIFKNDGSQTFPSAFNSCTALKNITFEGVIGNDINFQQSPLTPESMISIITRLKDYSDTTETFTRTVYFSDACWAALEAHSSAPNGGTWEDYVTSLGWNT